jgi:hypothetical protein
MLLDNLRVETTGDQVIVSATLTGGRTENKLLYKLPAHLAPHIAADTYDGFVLAALPLAMLSGERLIVRGAMSERLYYNLAFHYMHILHLAMPKYTEVILEPDTLSASALDVSEARGPASGFSGGVDSFYTLKRYSSDQIPLNYRLKYLYFNNVGSHGQKRFDEARAIFDAKFNAVSPVAAEVGLEFIKVDSNLNYVLRNVSLPETHTLRNISVALLLQPLFSKVLYSSGLPYKEQGFCNPAENFHDYIDSQTVHLLSTERTECLLVGATGGRIDKLEFLKNYGPAHKHLDVCIELRAKPGVNCCSCEKCLRTLTYLEANGSLERFGRAFDLEKYQRRRVHHIIFTVLGKSHDVTYRRVLDYRRSQGLTYPFALRVAGGFVRFGRRIAAAVSVAIGGKRIKQRWQRLEDATRQLRHRTQGKVSPS